MGRNGGQAAGKKNGRRDDLVRESQAMLTQKLMGGQMVYGVNNQELVEKPGEGVAPFR